MERNPLGVSNENRFIEPCTAKDGPGTVRCGKGFLANEREAPFSNPFFAELIQQIKSDLGSIKNYAQTSRGKFSDREFGEYYYRTLTGDIEKMEIVLNGLIDYMKLHPPIRKMNTVHNILEEVLTKHRVKLQEKGIKLLKRFEKDLPETVVPDEQLKYVLSSVLQYAMVATPPNRNIAISTKSFLPEKGAGEAEGLFKREGEHIRISVIFAVHHRRGEPTLGTGIIQKGDVPDILLRFVREVVLRNHGIMKMGTNPERTKIIISLRFPVERRKVVHYQSMN
ncbi:MAG TPA: hypothetical protein VMV04_09515 [Thermodesulfobacteriota bacterium]|nr:hypothetical protein [Thermodesulfobacteriota bacterium]